MCKEHHKGILSPSDKIAGVCVFLSAVGLSGAHKKEKSDYGTEL